MKIELNPQKLLGFRIEGPNATTAKKGGKGGAAVGQKGGGIPS
jgi:hypothetical protein